MQKVGELYIIKTIPTLPSLFQMFIAFPVSSASAEALWEGQGRPFILPPCHLPGVSREELPGSSPSPFAHPISPGFSPGAPWGEEMSENLPLLQSLSSYHLTWTQGRMMPI